MAVSIKRSESSILYSDDTCRVYVDLTGLPGDFHVWAEQQCLHVIKSVYRSVYEKGVRDAQVTMRKALGLSEY